MSVPKLTKEGRETLDFVLNVRPPIMRETRKQKYLDILSLLMSKYGCTEAGRELVIEAVRMIENKSFESFFHMTDDPDGFKRRVLEPHYDAEAYYEAPILVKRWDPPKSRPKKRPEEMRVVAFCTSPRQGGNSDVLVSEALRGAEVTGASGEKFTLQKLDMKLCTGCMKCKEPGFRRLCALKDDLTETVLPKIIEADAIIIGFPIYSERACGQLAVFLDRWNCFSRASVPDARDSQTIVGKTQEDKTSEIMRLSQRLFSPLLAPGRRAMVIGTWAYPYVDTYDHIIEGVITKLYATRIETVEALSAGGFCRGMFHGFDDQGKAMILRYPEQLEKAFLAGKSLVTGNVVSPHGGGD